LGQGGLRRGDRPPLLISRIPASPLLPRLNIKTRLFLAIVATNVVVALAFVIALQLSSNARFRDYVRERETRRVEALAALLGDAYAEHGGWEFLKDNAGLWNAINDANGPPRPVGPPQERRGGATFMRERIDGGPPPPPPPPKGGLGPPPRPPPPDDPRRSEIGREPRAMLVDIHGTRIAGDGLPGGEGTRVPVDANGLTVGWVVMPQPRLVAPDLRFLEEQSEATWTIAAFAVVLAALVAWALARGLIAPVKRLVHATHRLAAGDFAVRVDTRSRDELGQLVRDFNALAGTLQRTDETRREFLADVSHELRTPLAVCLAELEALQDGVRPVTPQALESLRTELATLTRLVEDLQKLAREDAGVLSYAMTPLDLSTLVQSALNAFAESFARRPLQVELAPGERTPLRVVGDRERLTQLFNNVFANCIRYTDPDGRVRVTLASEGMYARVDVEDSAPGVPPEALDRIFDRLYRVERSRSRASGGAGLGLAVCRAIAVAHHGTIEARASSLGGLMIRVRLPLNERRT